MAVFMNLLPEEAPVAEHPPSTDSAAGTLVATPPEVLLPPLEEAPPEFALAEPPIADQPPPPPADKPQPVSEKERITTVDMLRGFALLGILLMNMLSFSWPDGAYGSATSLYYHPDSIGDIPKEDKDKKEGVKKDEEAKDKKPKPTYAMGDIHIAAVESDADRFEYVFAHILVNNKMRTLFSMLFGAGIVLMAEHSRGRKISPAWLHYRRMFWMLMMGAFHAYFIWIGDILFGYAAIGLAIYPLRFLRARWLIMIGLFLFVFPITIMMVVPNIVDFVREQGRQVSKRVEYAKEAKAAEKAELEKTYGITLEKPSKEKAAKEKDPKPAAEKATTETAPADAPPVAAPSAETPAAESPATEAKGDAKDESKVESDEYKPPFPDSMFYQGFQSMERSRIEGRHPENMTRAIRDHKSQSYFTWFTERAMNILWMHLAFLFLGVLIMGWPMVIGMGLMKLGFFEGKWSTRAYARWAIILYLIGIPSEWFSLMWELDPRTNSMAWQMRITQPLEMLAMLTLTPANACALLWLYKTGRLNWLAWRLEAVGRMALSNYLFDSVFCVLLFSNAGPGLFAAIPRIGLAALVVGIWTFQLWVSPIWLRYFRFGPMEWLWRSLTYWKFQPMMVAKAKVAA